MRCKLLLKRSIGKATECSKRLRHIAIEKDIFSEPNRCIFQISLKYMKLVITKILFILVLRNFNCYFKITWPKQYNPPHTKIKMYDPPAKIVHGTDLRDWLNLYLNSTYFYILQKSVFRNYYSFIQDISVVSKNYKM